MTVQDKTNLIRHLFDAMRGLDILQPLLEEPSVTEIMVNSPSQIYIERNGRLEKTDYSFDSPAHLTLSDGPDRPGVKDKPHHRDQARGTRR